MQELNQLIGIKLLTSGLLENLVLSPNFQGGANARFAPLRTPMIRLSHRPQPSGREVHGEVDGLDIGGQHGRLFVVLRQTHRPQKGPCAICVRGAETSDTVAEAVRPNPRCSRKGHSRRVGAGDERTESRGVVETLRLPSVICPERRTYVVVG